MIGGWGGGGDGGGTGGTGFGPRSTYERARRRDAYLRLARLLGGTVRRGRRSRDLLDLEEVRRRLRVFEQSYVGVRPIPVSAIVGTVSRSREFDREFLPRGGHLKERWQRLERVFPEGEFPPISVYELDGRYFVGDGHHRVAIARQREMDYVDAEVTRLRSRIPLPPDADVARLIALDQERMFRDESGLERARPEARIEFTRPQGYVELLELVKIHGYHLMQQRRAWLPPEEAAADWYDRVYLPAVDAIRREGLAELFPSATEADLFLWVYQRQRDLFPERGGLPWEEAARTTREARGAGAGVGRSSAILTWLRRPWAGGRRSGGRRSGGGRSGGGRSGGRVSGP